MKMCVLKSHQSHPRVLSPQDVTQRVHGFENTLNF